MLSSWTTRLHSTVSKSLIFHKLKAFGCPRLFLEWLSECFVHINRCARLSGRTSRPLVNNSCELQGVVPYPDLFTTYIADLLISSSRRLFKYTDDVPLRRPVSAKEEFQRFSSNMPSIYDFLLQDCLHRNTLFRSVFPSEQSIIN